MLAAEERRTLLRIARASVTARVTAAAAPPVDSTETRLGGAFVTLRIAQALRGCIGRVTADRPLVETVQHVAAAAASEDPRFPPVRAEEFGEVVIEVSVIGPLEVCAGPAEIEVGRHGVVVDDGPRRGLLLPQVAIEWAGIATHSSPRRVSRQVCGRTPGRRLLGFSGSRRRSSLRATSPD